MRFILVSLMAIVGVMSAFAGELNCLDRAELIPVSFSYAGKSYHGLGDLQKLVRSEKQVEGGVKIVYSGQLDESVEVRLEGFKNREYGEIEYTLWFENRSRKISGVLSDVMSFDGNFEGEKPFVRGIKGDHWAGYEPYALVWPEWTNSPKTFESTGGRATHGDFPYFDLVHGNGGTMIALGWAGTWRATFTARKEGVALRAEACLGLKSVLLPGERFRSALVVMMPYEGRDAERAYNRWRAWFLDRNMPKANAAGDPIKPFSTTCFAADTGRPNSDGSISEGWDTWKPTLEKLKKEKLVFDFRWFDAGWYSDPSGKTVPKDWFGTVGSWQLDQEKWPNGSLRKSNEACHRAGMKVLTWFEPERVTHVSDLVRNHGYKAEWCLGGEDGPNNLGDAGCLDWTAQRIIKMMDENAIDLYREDCNADSIGGWRTYDDRTSKQHGGVARQGSSENLGIQGHYALWDRILAYCAKAGKCTFVDSCASGGGRNDIESMRRGVPFMRSDSDRTTVALKLSMTWGFPRWIPFHGTHIREANDELSVAEGSGPDFYLARASYLPIVTWDGAFSHNAKLNFDRMRAIDREWKSVNHLLTKDFYAITPWHDRHFTGGWTAFAYDDPKKGEAVLLAFRVENAAESEFVAKLSFVDRGATYELHDVDSARKWQASGEELAKGLTISLPKPRSSSLIRIQRK